MSADSKIQWCHHTFNPWWGCARVSPGCVNCYAEAWAKRTGHDVWGKDGERRFFGDKHWRAPLLWDAQARTEGVRSRVFCASMADVFEDHPALLDHRARLFNLIYATSSLDWLLLTKRPENIERLLPGPLPGNVWLGTTIEDQQRAHERLAHLSNIPVSVRFASCEPLLERVDLFIGDTPPLLDWVIIGGESGPRARPFDLAWARDLIEQCEIGGMAPFVKQLGAVWAKQNGADSHGGDPAFWPDDLRVRTFPIPRFALEQQ